MKFRIIIISVLAILALVAGAIWWRGIHRAPKYVPAKKTVITPAVKKEYRALPAITKRFARPKVAIVMDDFGYNTRNIDRLFNIRHPITLSILPHLAYSNEIADAAYGNGHEAILHLPLEPVRQDVRQEADTINSRMSEKEVIARLEEDLNSIKGLRGVSNHMGSKSTGERALITVIFGDLKKRGLYFFDSLTAPKSICQEVARRLGVRYAKRDIFLDMGKPNNPDYIKGQVLEMRRLAFRRGRAIAVCHDRKDTINVLSEMMPQLSADGIQFVYLSELVN